MDLLTRGHVSHITLFISGAAEKEKFIRLADEDKDRYLEEMKVWEAKQRGVTLKASKVRIGETTSSWSSRAGYLSVPFDFMDTHHLDV